jgi:hypothetical protein
VIEQTGIGHSPSIRHDSIFQAFQIEQTLGLYHFCKTSIRYKSRSEAFRHPSLLALKGYDLHTVLQKLQGICLFLLLDGFFESL